MAAGKSGGSAGGVFLKGTLGSPSGEEKFADTGVSATPGPWYSALCSGWAWDRGGPDGRWPAGNALQARRLRVRPGQGSGRPARGGAVVAQRAEAQGGLRGARRRLGLAPTSIFSMVA